MDPRINVAEGFHRGLSATLQVFDQVDARKRRQIQQGKEDLLHEQYQDDRRTRMERSKVLESRTDEQYEQGKLDADVQRERSSADFEHQEALRPFQLQEAQALQSQRYTQQQTANLQLRNAKRQETNGLARQVVMEAQALREGGDDAGAMEKYAELSNYGFDVDDITNSDTPAARKTLDQLVSGQIQLTSPEAQSLVKKVLNPSFYMSGRDPTKFEVAGLVPIPDKGTFTVSLMNKETGDFVPATLGMSSEVNDDMVTEVTMEDLMSAATSYIALEDQMVAAKQSGIKARLGIKADKGSTLADAKTQAQTAKLIAETAKINKELGDNPERTAQVESLLESYESTDPEGHAVAVNLQHAPEFDVNTAPYMVAGVQKLMANNDSMSVQVATKRFVEATRVQAKVPMQVELLTNATPGLNERKVTQLVEKKLLGEISDAAYAKRLEALIAQAKRKAALQEQPDISEAPLRSGSSLNSIRW